jgi:glutaminyl-peptide cyclotransferase
MLFPDQAGREMMELVEWQLSFGVRCPGSEGHLAVRAAMEERIGDLGHEPVRQPFAVRLGGKNVACANVVVRVGPQDVEEGPLLIGTHWDSRLVADREERPELRGKPIPGANDGGSGTAVLLYLLGRLGDFGLRREVQLAFFDAEDVGNIDGNEFSRGAAYLAEHPVGRPPREVIALDMVGGAGMVLDRDAHAAHHRPSWKLTQAVFGIGRELGQGPFTASKPEQWKYIISDHHPFLVRGIPAVILIDIDYPPWHTHGDLPAAMHADSLAAVLRVVATYVSRFAA